MMPIRKHPHPLVKRLNFQGSLGVWRRPSLFWWSVRLGLFDWALHRGPKPAEQHGSEDRQQWDSGRCNSSSRWGIDECFLLMESSSSLNMYSELLPGINSIISNCPCFEWKREKICSYSWSSAAHMSKGDYLFPSWITVIFTIPQSKWLLCHWLPICMEWWYPIWVSRWQFVSGRILSRNHF